MKLAYMIVAIVGLSASSALQAADPQYAAPAAPAAATAPAAPAAPTAPATSVASAKPGKDPNRVICKTEEVTGSRLGSNKVCLTAAGWRERAFRAGQWAEHQSTYNSSPNGR